MQRSWLAMIFCTAALSAPLRADEPAPHRPLLHVPTGQPCLDSTSLGRRIDAWLGAAPLDPRLEVHAEERPSGEASFRVTRGSEQVAERTFTPAPPSCVEREATMALAIALALKASSARDEPGARLGERSGAGRVVIGLSALRHLGALPEPGWGGELALDWLRRTTFGARFWLALSSGRAVAMPDTDGQFDARLAALGASGCAHTARRFRLAGAACVGLAAGLLTFQGRNFQTSYLRRDAWATVTATAVLDLQLSQHWSVATRLSLRALLTPVQLDVRDDANNLVSSRELASFGGDIALGPAFTFR